MKILPGNPTRNIAASPNQSSKLRQPTLFHTIINMVAMSEGGLLSSDHPEYTSACNDALYGILINKSHRMIYDKDYSLDLLPLE